MTYLQVRKRPYQKFIRVIIIIVLFLIACAVGIHLFAPHFFPSIVTAIARPFWRIQFSIVEGALHSPEYLLQRNQILENQLMEIQVRFDTVSAIQTENKELKELFGRTIIETLVTISPSVTGSTTEGLATYTDLVNPDAKILAAVLKRPPYSMYDELIIDIGNDQGVSTSSIVYASGGVMIGKVVQVLNKTARVRLLSSSGETYEVLIGDNNTPATAFGRGGGQYEAQVSRDIDIEEGDFVISPALNDKPFGVVSAVLVDPAQPFKTILFAPPINIYQLRWVLVENR